MLLTLVEFAKQFGYTARLLRSHAKSKILPAKLYGNNYLINSEKIEKYRENLAKLDKKKGLSGGRPRKIII